MAQQAAHSAPSGRRHEQAFQAARQGLSGTWKREELEELLSVSKNQALNYIRAWLDTGDIIKVDDPKDHYSFVEVR